MPANHPRAFSQDPPRAIRSPWLFVPVLLVWILCTPFMVTGVIMLSDALQGAYSKSFGFAGQLVVGGMLFGAPALLAWVVTWAYSRGGKKRPALSS